MSELIKWGYISLNFFNNPFSALRILSKSIQRKGNEMSCSIDSCKIETDQLLHDFFLCYSTEFMRLFLCFCLCDCFIYCSHLLNIILNEIFFRIILNSKPWVQNLSDYFPDFHKHSLKITILRSKVNSSHWFSKKKWQQNILSSSRSVEHSSRKFSQSYWEGSIPNLFSHCLFREEYSDQYLAD